MAVWDRYTHDVAGMATPLTDAGDFDALLDRVGQAQVVMLGEASHGTHEFYQWRASLTQRLITELGFAFVAVEGDWPDCERVDRSVRGAPEAVGLGGMAGGEGPAEAPEDPRAALGAFERWPTWMWANEEAVDFCRWLRRFNNDREPAAKVGFHGLDVYSLWESLRAILLHLREHDPDSVEEALAAYRCFEPYGEDPQRYALATRFVPEGCEDQVVDLLTRMRERATSEGVRPDSEELSAWQNAEVVAGADRYYRAMVRGNVESWNIRDRHLAETLDRLLAYYGPGAKGVVWAHNTHVGDARATTMADAGEVTIGQLGRDRYGRDNVVLVGFGCHRGTVVAGDAWGAPMRVMPVPAACNGSLEDILHDTAPERALFVFPDAALGAPASDLLTDWLGHRAIGVVYHPERERWGNYVPTRLGDRYDAFVWTDQTRGVRPLRMRQIAAAEPETYPAGV